MNSDFFKRTTEAMFGGDYAASLYYDTVLEQKKTALLSEYQKSLAELEAEKLKTAGVYSSKLNMAVASSEKSAKNFGEKAASSGLNDGAGQKAELIRDNVLREKLKSIKSSEQDAMAKIEGRKAKLKDNYISKLEKAETEAEKERQKTLEKARKSTVTVLPKSSTEIISNNRLINKAEERDEYRLSEQYERLRDDMLDKLGLGGKTIKGL